MMMSAQIYNDNNINTASSTINVKTSIAANILYFIQTIIIIVDNNNFKQRNIVSNITIAQYLLSTDTDCCYCCL